MKKRTVFLLLIVFLVAGYFCRPWVDGLIPGHTKQSWSPALQTPIQFRDVRFLFDDHFGLTRDAEFTDNALYLLLEDPTKNSPTQVVPIGQSSQ